MNRYNRDQNTQTPTSRNQRNQYQSRLNSGYPRGERSQSQSWNGSSFDNADEQYQNENDRSTKSYGRDQYNNEQYYNTQSHQPNQSERYNNERSTLGSNSSTWSNRNDSDRNDYINQSERFNNANNNTAGDYSARDYGSSDYSNRDYGNENRNRYASSFEQDRAAGMNQIGRNTPSYSGNDRYTSRFDEMNRTGSYHSGKLDNQFTAGQHSGKGPKNYKRADTRIHEEVCDALAADAHIDASEIDVAVKEGVVTLTGTVTERRMKRLAEDCAEQIRGVTDVKNELSTQSSSNESSETDSNKSASSASKTKTGSTQTKNFM